MIRPSETRARANHSRSWFACYTRSRHEKRVDSRLTSLGFESYLPTIVRVSQWHDRSKLIQWPLFPGYVFVRTGRECLDRIVATDGVVTIVHFGGRPAPILDDEIQNIRLFAAAIEESGDIPRPVPQFRKGQTVVVRAGPFQGVTGVILERRSSDRVLMQVGLTTIEVGFKIELDATCLRRAGRRGVRLGTRANPGLEGRAVLRASSSRGAVAR